MGRGRSGYGVRARGPRLTLRLVLDRGRRAAEVECGVGRRSRPGAVVGAGAAGHWDER